jgi:hypothetical protein
LNGNVGVADYLTTLKILRRSIVCVVRIGEGSGLEIGNLDLEVDCLTGANDIIVLGVDHDGRDHSVSGRDLAHG